jgi:hypothetical protein
MYRAVFADGFHLASSKDTYGAFRGALLDNQTNVLKGQAEFVKVDVADGDSGQDRLRVALAAAAGVVGTLVVVKVAHRVKRWWIRDRPTLTAARARRTEATDDAPTAMLTLVAPPECELSEHPLDEAVEG